MQTFVPYSDLKLCAKSLDDRRLGKQRSECLIILATIEKKRHAPPEARIGWKNHPAVLMWEGYEDFLIHYATRICVEWRKRGYKDTTLEKFLSLRKWVVKPNPPSWWGDVRVHVSHRSKLIQKNPDHYRDQFPRTPEGLEYFWPSKEIEYAQR